MTGAAVALLSVEDLCVMHGDVIAAQVGPLLVHGGEVAALIGPNGAGKSSVLRAVAGLGAPARGRVLLGGAPVRDMTPALRARAVAYLPQAPEAAWPVSVEALIALGRFSYGAAPDRLQGGDRLAVDRALEQVHLTALCTRMMSSLSGGERARAHLARALAQEAPLLALDEPTAEFDPAHALAVLDAISAHAHAGGGVLFTTHDVGFAARAAAIVHVMKQGRVIASGAPLEILTPDLLYAAYGRRGRIELIDGVPAIAFF